MSRYPTADKIRQIPIEPPSPTPYPQVTVEDILNRLFARVKQRRKAGCCTMSTISLDPLVHWGEHSDPESAGEEVVKVLKELGYNIISYYVERELVDEEDRIIPEKEEWEVRAVQVSFDWITKT